MFSFLTKPVFYGETRYVCFTFKRYVRLDLPKAFKSETEYLFMFYGPSNKTIFQNIFKHILLKDIKRYFGINALQFKIKSVQELNLILKLIQILNLDLGVLLWLSFQIILSGHAITTINIR